MALSVTAWHLLPLKVRLYVVYTNRQSGQGVIWLLDKFAVSLECSPQKAYPEFVIDSSARHTFTGGKFKIKGTWEVHALVCFY